MHLCVFCLKFVLKRKTQEKIIKLLFFKKGTRKRVFWDFTVLVKICGNLLHFSRSKKSVQNRAVCQNCAISKFALKTAAVRRRSPFHIYIRAENNKLPTEFWGWFVLLMICTQLSDNSGYPFVWIIKFSLWKCSDKHLRRYKLIY